MRFEDLLRRTADLPVIESATLRALGEPREALAVQLGRWVKAGRLVQVRRGLYALPEPFRRAPLPAEYLANIAVRPSYVSLERALDLHGFLPEAVACVTCVTTARPRSLETAWGPMRFRHVDPRWFFGFGEMDVAGGRALVADPEKALLDLVHLSAGEFTPARIAELRLAGLDRLDTGRLEAMAQRGGPRIRRAARAIRDFAVHAGEVEEEL